MLLRPGICVIPIRTAADPDNRDDRGRVPVARGHGLAELGGHTGQHPRP